MDRDALQTAIDEQQRASSEFGIIEILKSIKSSIPKQIGSITTASLSTAAGAEEIIAVPAVKVAAGDKIFVSIEYDGAGDPIAGQVQDVVAGVDFDLVITNAGAAALNATAVIHFVIF